MTKRNIAITQMLLCAALWSIAGIFIKLIPWNPLALAGARSLIAAGAIFIIICFRKIKITVSRHVIATAAFMALTFLSFVAANKLTTAANAIALQYTSPLFIMVYAAVFKHTRQTRRDIVTVLITLTGIIFCFADSLDAGHLTGNLVGILAGAAAGGMYVTLGGSASERERLSAVFFGQLFTAAVGVPFIFIISTPFTPVAIGSLFVLGIVQLGIPYVLLALASENCPPLACSILSAVEPLLNPVWVLIFAGEAPGISAIIGGIIIIAAVTMWCVGNQRSRVNT
jgi:Predicted permease, DMT superfamily